MKIKKFLRITVFALMINLMVLPSISSGLTISPIKNYDFTYQNNCLYGWTSLNADCYVEDEVDFDGASFEDVAYGHIYQYVNFRIEDLDLSDGLPTFEYYYSGAPLTVIIKFTLFYGDYQLSDTIHAAANLISEHHSTGNGIVSFEPVIRWGMTPVSKILFQVYLDQNSDADLIESLQIDFVNFKIDYNPRPCTFRC
ncbi:MAG: hypothetical protein INQ03_04425 [Candidatus Heimdallarchaeota archaeon]|nr:hypothetical protein [Candidatus Heimdallarchaeota archaeon]